MRACTFAFTALALSSSACGSASPDRRNSDEFGAARRARSEPSEPSARSEFDSAPRPETKEACDGCGGLWDIHGIAELESCVCATNDGGRECTDGGQCQGSCLLDEAADLRMIQPGEPDRGFYVGQCASFDTTFGCFRIIPVGMAARGAHPAGEGFEDICVD